MIAIPPDVRRSLRTPIQKEVLDVLAEFDQFMCPAEINAQFDKKKNASRLADALEILVAKGYVEESEIHTRKVYRVVTSKLQSVTCKLQSVTSKLQSVTDSHNQSTYKHEFNSTQLNQSKKEFSETESQGSCPEPVAVGQAVETAPSPAPALPERPKAEQTEAPIVFRLGLVFRDPNKPTESLCRMHEQFFNEDGTPKTTTDPDSTMANPLPPIPMAEAFAKYYKQAYDYSRKRRVPLRDFVLHRIAFFLTYDDDFELGDKHSVKEFIEHGILDNKRSPWNPILADLADVYVFREFGWDGTLLSDRKVWEAEARYARDTGNKRRSHLFLSYFEKRKNAAKRVEDLELREQSVPVPCGGSTVRGDPPHPILASIAEKLGEKRFDLWFGQDTVCTIEGGKPVFDVRNAFRSNSIRRHCSPEITETLKALGYAGEPEYRVREMEPTLTQ